MTERDAEHLRRMRVLVEGFSPPLDDGSAEDERRKAELRALFEKCNAVEHLVTRETPELAELVQVCDLAALALVNRKRILNGELS